MRLSALLEQIRYSPAESVVLVGHSHFFRELLKAYLHDDFDARDPELAAALRKKKLSNCGVRADTPYGRSRPRPFAARACTCTPDALSRVLPETLSRVLAAHTGTHRWHDSSWTLRVAARSPSSTRGCSPARRWWRD